MTRPLVWAGLFVALGCGSTLPGPTEPLVPTPRGSIPSSPPPVGPPTDAALPVAREYRLPSGMTVRYLRREGADVVAAYLASTRGGEVYPAREAGLGRLATGSLALTATNLLDGTPVESHVDNELGMVGATVRPRDLDELLAAMARAVIEANPSDEIVQHARVAQLNAMRDAMHSSTSTALAAAMAHVYRYPHHLMAPLHGDLNVLADTTAARVREAIAERWSPEACVLVIVGDVEDAALDSLVSYYFREFETREGTDPGVPVPPTRQPRTVHAFHDGSDTASIILVDMAPRTNDGDEIPFEALSYLTAGHFSSRLNQLLRTEHTLTYGAHSTYERSRLAGTFLLAVAVPADDANQALGVLLTGLQQVVDGPIAGAEIARVKRLMESRVRSALDGPRPAAMALVRGWVRDEPADHFNTQVAAIRSVTVADVERVAAEWVHANEMSIFMTGDMNEIRPEERLTGYGEVRLLQFRDD